MSVKSIPSLLTQAMKRQYPGKFPDTRFMKTLARLRGASRELPVGTMVSRVVVVGGSVAGEWVGVDLMTETLIVKVKNGQLFHLKDDPFRLEVKMKVLSEEESSKAKKEIIEAIEFAKQRPGAGGIAAFTQDHGDPPFSHYDGLCCNEKVICEELSKLIKMLE